MRSALLPLLAATVVSCSQPEGDTPSPIPADAPDARQGEAETPLAVETQEGPVTATLSLAPPEPRLGDPLTLILIVTAKTGATVEMPAFGDALGRFAIVDFTPREEATADGVRLSQRYTLQAPMSGRQRIPRLRLEFLDERAPDAVAKPTSNC